MGLDDFKGEPTDEHKELEGELSHNTPPSDEDRWRDHEPGVPDWANKVCGGEIDADEVDKYEGGVILYIRPDGEGDRTSSETISSDKYISLDDAV